MIRKRLILEVLSFAEDARLEDPCLDGCRVGGRSCKAHHTVFDAIG